MLVRELIEKLQAMPANAHVKVHNDEMGDFDFAAEVKEIEGAVCILDRYGVEELEHQTEQ